MAQYYEGIGRRKQSTARVRVTSGSGKFLVNEKPLDVYFGRMGDMYSILLPFNALDQDSAGYDVSAKVSGGGVSGRITSYNVCYTKLLRNPPVKKGFCDKDQSELYQRVDDKAETVKNRIDVYWEQTSPLIDYYRESNLLAEIDGTQPIEDVTSLMLTAVQRRNS